MDDKLIRLYTEINRRENLKIHLAHLDEIIKARGEEKEILAESLAKEERDVAEMETLTLYSLFSMVLGTHEKQLEKERQEYLHAFMLLHGVEENYKSLIEERDLLIKSLNGLQFVDQEFERLVKRKDRLLKNTATYPEELITLNERIASFKMQIKEIESAIIKGNTSKNHLRKVVFNLERLEHWGFQKRYSGSSSVIGKTKQVQKQIITANKCLQKYEDQLFAISAHFNINFEKQIENLEAFLDRFIDDLITDWVVNKKIQNSVHLVTSMIDTITKLNGSLEFEKGKVKKYLEEDTDLKSDIILELLNKNKS